MKLNLSICAIVFLASVIGLSAQQNSLDLYFFNNKSIRVIDNRFAYQFQPFKHTQALLSGVNLNETRLNFNQNTKISNLDLDISQSLGITRHHLYSGFDYHFDKNDLETDLAAFNSRMGYLGYGIDIQPLDSLNLSLAAKGFTRNEKDRYLDDSKLRGDGYQLQSRASYSYYGSSGFYGLSGDLDHKYLDWETYESMGMSAFINHDFSRTQLSSFLQLNSRNDHLYLLEENETPGLGSSYVLTDKQKRWYLISDSRLDYNALENWDLSLVHSYLQRKTRLEENLNRNNADYQNQVNLESQWRPASGLRHQITINHSYAIKDFSFSNSNRHTETRLLGSYLYWEYSPGDSISIGSSIDLQRTSYPNDDHNLDNDLRHINLSLAWKSYYKDRIRIANRLLWSIKDDVYVDSLLSANNNKVNSLSLIPELAILLGDRLLLKQSYFLRADYTDYMYPSESQEDGFYRQFSAKYNLIFDSFPYIARSNDSRWIDLPYRSGNDKALLVDALLAYDRYEYGYEENSRYIIDSLTERYTMGLSIRHDIGSFFYQISPRMVMGTWREYNLLFSLAYEFDNMSILELSINPIGEFLDSLDWRTNLTLKLNF